MLLMLIKFFLVALAMAIAWALVACGAIILTEQPKRDKKLREEGYDLCIDDILNLHQYWDRAQRKYIDIEIKTE